MDNQRTNNKINNLNSFQVPRRGLTNDIHKQKQTGNSINLLGIGSGMTANSNLYKKQNIMNIANGNDNNINDDTNTNTNTNLSPNSNHNSNHSNSYSYQNRNNKNIVNTITKNIIKDSQSNAKTLSIMSNLNYYDTLKKMSKLDMDFVYQGRNVYITLTTIPPRFLSNEFDKVLRLCYDQLIPATKIYLSIPVSYKRVFTPIYSENDIVNKIAVLKNNYPNLEIIRCNDYGPATKLLGLIEHHANLSISNQIMNKFDPNDIIIVLDDDMQYTNNIVMTYLNAFNLYEADVCAFGQELFTDYQPYKIRQVEELYHDNYKDTVYGWLSFAIKYERTVNIYTFYNQMVKSYPKLEYHDDLLFSLYCSCYKLYKIGINTPLFKYDESRTKMDNSNALRNSTISNHNVRKQLESEITVFNNLKYTPVYEIPEKIPKRNIYLVDEFKVVNISDNIHIIPTYVSHNILLLTITVFNPALYRKVHTLTFTIKNKSYKVDINLKQSVDKFTIAIYIQDQQLSICEHNNKNQYKIIQTNQSSEMTKNKLYSIMTILNYAPEFEYVFFDNDNLYKFIKNNYRDIVYDAITNIVPGAYVSDLFRYCYLYLMGGIYIDCKKILYVPLQNIINNDGILNDEIFVKDVPANYCYNSIMICKTKNPIMRKAICKCIENSIKNEYTNDSLSVTGPGLLGSIITKYNYKYFHKQISNKHAESIIVDNNNNIITKNTYFGYYNENNYINTSHYAIMWTNKKVYRQKLNKYVNVKVIDLNDETLLLKNP